MNEPVQAVVTRLLGMVEHDEIHEQTLHFNFFCLYAIYFT